VRLWHAHERNLQLAGGSDPGWSLPVPAAAGPVTTPEGASWLEPVDGPVGHWLELAGRSDEELRHVAPRVTPIVAAVLEAERQRAFVADELAGRYEEIDLLYAISEILGRTVRLEEAAQIIVREVSAVVGARRASIMVYDESSRTLRTVAARGFEPDGLMPVDVEDVSSVAARVFRDQRIVTFDPADPGSVITDAGANRVYR
jgi:hypothetical protein